MIPPALLLCLFQVTDETDVKIDYLIEQLAEDLAARRNATEELLRLRRERPGIRKRLRERLRGKLDPRARARLEYILDVKMFERRWTADAGGRVRMTTAAEGKVFCVVGNSLAALDAESGKELWRRPLPAQRVTACDAVGLYVFVDTLGGKGTREIEVLRAGDGRSVRTFAGCRSRSDGTYYLFLEFSTARPRYVSGRDLTRSGQLSFPTLDLSFFKGRLVAAGTDRSVRCIDMQEGRPLWTVRLEAGEYPYRLAAGEKTAAVWSTTGTTLALDIGTGARKWSVSPGDTSFPLPAVVGGSVILVGADGGILAYSEKNGARRWKADLGWGGSNPRFEVGLLKSALVVPGPTRTVVLDARSGEELFAFPWTGNRPPGILGNMIFVPAGNRVVAYRLQE